MEIPENCLIPHYLYPLCQVVLSLAFEAGCLWSSVGGMLALGSPFVWWPRELLDAGHPSLHSHFSTLPFMMGTHPLNYLPSLSLMSKFWKKNLEASKGHTQGFIEIKNRLEAARGWGGDGVL